MSQKKVKQMRKVDRVLSLMPEEEKRLWRIAYKRTGKSLEFSQAFDKRIAELKSLDKKLRGRV